MTKRQKQQYTEQSFLELMADLKAEKAAINGSDQGLRPRFKGFKIVEEVSSMIERALDQFADGKIQLAGEIAEGALKSLRSRQRWYVRNSPDKYFCNEIEIARKKGYGDDLIARATKRVNAINTFVRASDSFDLDQASALYWAAEDCLDQIFNEHQSRLRKAETKRKEADLAQNRDEINEILRKANAKAEESRKAQVIHDEREAMRRTEVAAKLREELVTV